MPPTAGNSRLRRAEEHRAKLLRLCSLAGEIARLADERATLRKIVSTARSLMGVQSAHVALVDERRQTLHGVASSGRRSPGALPVHLSDSAAARQALRRRTPVSIDRAARDRRVSASARRAPSIGGVAYLPLLSGSESFGLLILVTRRPHAWSREESTLAQHLANFAAVALENLELLKRLAEAEGRFRNLVEHIPAIAYICDFEPPYRSIYVSPQLETMLGYPPSAWMDDPDFWMKILHPDDMKPPLGFDDETVKETEFFTSEYRVRDSLGEIRWMHENAVLVRDPAGAPIGWHGVLVEITGQKTIEQSLPAVPPRDRPPFRRAPLN
jgi:PAS domain S-box-containing protein